MLRKGFSNNNKKIQKSKIWQSFANYNIANFDRRLLFRYHNDAFYDKYHNLALDKYIFDKAMNKESKIAQEIESSDYLYVKYQEIEEEVLNRTDSRLIETPEIVGDYEYESEIRTDKEDTYHIMSRYSLETGERELVFDPKNDKIVPKAFLSSFSFMKLELSDDQQKVGVILDIKNDEMPTGFIKDLNSGNVLGDRLTRAAEMKFSQNGKYIIWVARDYFSLRNSKLYLHQLGDYTADNQKLLMEETDESAWLSLDQSKCNRYLLVISTSHSGKDVNFFFLIDSII